MKVITYDVLNYIEEIIKMTHIQLIGIAFNFMFQVFGSDQRYIKDKSIR